MWGAQDTGAEHKGAFKCAVRTTCFRPASFLLEPFTHGYKLQGLLLLKAYLEK